MKLRILAPAKVNLHLAVGEAGTDGYHPVDTVLHALELDDTVEITDGVPFSFSCTPDLGLPAEENLAMRAARAMSVRFGRSLDMAITVAKRIPAGAGLGGASSDAAAVIGGIADLWALEGAETELHEVARSLGADVPFFLEGGAALFGGRGDVFRRRLRPLDAPVVVVKPHEPVLTAQAYAAFDALSMPGVPSADALVEALEDGDPASVAAHLYNAMTPASIAFVPAIAGALRLVAESHGVLGSAMAGSGSAVFGICADGASAASCAATARAAGFWAVATQLSPSGCVVSRV